MSNKKLAKESDREEEVHFNQKEQHMQRPGSRRKRGAWERANVRSDWNAGIGGVGGQRPVQGSFLSLAVQHHFHYPEPNIYSDVHTAQCIIEALLVLVRREETGFLHA